ncbi:MAG: ATP-binding cassette domain-containing protein, partial [Rhodospirillaceae bacterium]|nr:ATP-binding cassette domain-containing protein [Rhodospirillaceae bacterium]
TVLPPGQRPPDAVPILRNVSFKLDPGDVLGVVGPSASGKTTLCRILVGAWQPFQGKIRLDGGELRHWDPAVLGPQIGYLPQDVELFADSVRNNIARFDPEADDAAVLAAAQAADVHDMILRLKDGYNTQIGEAGAALSAGQRQRIGLARALFGNPRFLVLDEPNANLDTQGEAALMQAIERARTGGATVVLVTHRLQILSQVTKMLVLRDGQVDRFGPRDTVLAELRGPRQVPATGQGG